MEFYQASMENIEILKQYLKHNRYRGCEFSAANNILWARYYQTGFTIIEDMLVFVHLNGDCADTMSFPIGEKDPRPAFEAIRKYFEENSLPFRMFLVQPEMFQKIEEWYPDVYKISYQRDNADYLYEWDTLANLTGKKLHGKRNHINRFLEHYPDYQYEKIDGKNYKECLKVAYDWAEENIENGDSDKIYEECALKLALENREQLGLSGGLIRVEGKVVAFTLGERLTEDTYVVHFEKAYASVQGAYPMINREFVRRELSGYKYVNREEDMGIPGLRHAKTSYQPICLVEKGLVTLR